MAHPPELRERANELRAQGLLVADIAERIGVSEPTVVRWTNPELEDRERRKAKRRKFDKKRKCPNCNRVMSNPSKLCQRCFRASQQHWTRERVIEAMLLWAAKNGRRPKHQDWQRSGPDHPAISSIVRGPNRPFKSWGEAVKAAGFRLDRSKKRLTPFDRQRRAELRRDVREQKIKKAVEKGEQ